MFQPRLCRLEGVFKPSELHRVGFVPKRNQNTSRVELKRVVSISVCVSLQVFLRKAAGIFCVFIVMRLKRLRPVSVSVCSDRCRKLWMMVVVDQSEGVQMQV